MSKTKRNQAGLQKTSTLDVTEVSNPLRGTLELF